MSIFIGGREISDVYIGGSRARAVYRGDVKIWPTDTTEPPQDWAYHDDFERSTIGADWSGNGGLISAGALRKNTSAGASDYWLNRQFASDEIEVVATLGPVQDAAQRAAIMIGSAERFIAVEFSKNASTVFSHVPGGQWPSLGNFGARPWTAGDTITFSNLGGVVTVKRNDEIIFTAPTPITLGAGNRAIGLSVRGDRVFVVNFYGPTFDDVKVWST